MGCLMSRFDKRVKTESNVEDNDEDATMKDNATRCTLAVDHDAKANYQTNRDASTGCCWHS